VKVNNVKVRDENILSAEQFDNQKSDSNEIRLDDVPSQTPPESGITLTMPN